MWGKSNTINKSSSCADVGRKVGIVLCPGRAEQQKFLAESSICKILSDWLEDRHTAKM